MIILSACGKKNVDVKETENTAETTKELKTIKNSYAENIVDCNFRNLKYSLPESWNNLIEKSETTYSYSDNINGFSLNIMYVSEGIGNPEGLIEIMNGIKEESLKERSEWSDKEYYTSNNIHGIYGFGNVKLAQADRYEVLHIFIFEIKDEIYMVCMYINRDSKWDYSEDFFKFLDTIKSENDNNISSGIVNSTTTKNNEKPTEELTQKQPETSSHQQTENQTQKQEESSTVLSAGKQNALKSAKNYLSFSNFSYLGLIEQLEYEKYSYEDAVYAADNCGADWNEQALKTTESYLDYTTFSFKSLVEQLEYEKFTSEQANYAANNCGVDWNEQAAKTAKNYLEMMPFSREELIEQLEFEGFTHEQAVYGVEKNGY